MSKINVQRMLTIPNSSISFTTQALLKDVATLKNMGDKVPASHPALELCKLNLNISRTKNAYFIFIDDATKHRLKEEEKSPYFPSDLSDYLNLALKNECEWLHIDCGKTPYKDIHQDKDKTQKNNSAWNKLGGIFKGNKNEDTVQFTSHAR